MGEVIFIIRAEPLQLEIPENDILNDCSLMHGLFLFSLQWHHSWPPEVKWNGSIICQTILQWAAVSSHGTKFVYKWWQSVSMATDIAFMWAVGLVSEIDKWQQQSDTTETITEIWPQSYSHTVCLILWKKTGGSMVEQCLELFPLSKKVTRSPPSMRPFWVEFACTPVYTYIFSG